MTPTAEPDTIQDNADVAEGSSIPSRIKVLEFGLGTESYGVMIADAQEVLELPLLTKIPYAPDFVKGAMNLRGEILSVIDIREFFGLAPGNRSDQAKVIVTDVTGTSIGVLADSVRGTLEIETGAVQPPPLMMQRRKKGRVLGQVELEGRILILLDFEVILNGEAIVRLRRGQRAQ